MRVLRDTSTVSSADSGSVAPAPLFAGHRAQVSHAIVAAVGPEGLPSGLGSGAEGSLQPLSRRTSKTSTFLVSPGVAFRVMLRNGSNQRSSCKVRWSAGGAKVGEDSETFEYYQGSVVHGKGGVIQLPSNLFTMPKSFVARSPLGDGGEPLALVDRMGEIDLRKRCDAHGGHRLLAAAPGDARSRRPNQWLKSWTHQGSRRPIDRAADRGRRTQPWEATRDRSTSRGW